MSAGEKWCQGEVWLDRDRVVWEGSRKMMTCASAEIARAVVTAHNAQVEAKPVAWTRNSGCRDYVTFSRVEAADWKAGPLAVRPLYTFPPSAVAVVERWRADVSRTADEMEAADQIISALKEGGL